MDSAPSPSLARNRQAMRGPRAPALVIVPPANNSTTASRRTTDVKDIPARMPLAKGKVETRRLLAKLLVQTESIVRAAPRAWEASQGKGKEREEEGSDDEDDGPRGGRGKVMDWGTDLFEAMVQLRDVLIFSEKRGWNLFMTSDTFDAESEISPPPSPNSPRSRFMRSASFGNMPPSPSSPSHGNAGANLFHTTTSLLADVTLLARRPIESFSPTMPPLGLQLITLHVATVLLACTKGRSKESAAVGTAMLGGLDGWGPGMKARLLAFYEELLVDSLERTNQPSTQSTRVDGITIRIDGPTDTYDGRHLASTSKERTSHILLLVPPLLNAALASPSPATSTTTYHMERLLTSLVQLKPDLPLDLLDIIAYGSSYARSSAYSLLETMYPALLDSITTTCRPQDVLHIDPRPTGESIAPFPLPTILDSSPRVEDLVAAIESSLQDHNPSTQEAGLLLLSRHCPPTSFVSHYALERLVRAVIGWILDESTLFAITQRSAASTTASLAQSNREFPSRDHEKDGSDYIMQRANLLARIALPYLLRIHELDPAAYADIVFSQTASISAVRDDLPGAMGLKGLESLQSIDSMYSLADTLLRNLVRLHQSEVTFSVFHDLFTRWIDDVSLYWPTLRRADEALLSFRQLPRLFQPTDTSRHTRRLSGSSLREQGSSFGPWEVILSTAHSGAEGLRRSLRWIRILAQSGVEISPTILDQLVSLCEDSSASLNDAIKFAESLYLAAWSRSHRKAVGDVASKLYRSQATHITSYLDRGESDVVIAFIRRTLGAFLLAAGCGPETLLSIGFTTRDESRVLGNAFKRPSLVTPVESIDACDQPFLEALTRHNHSDVAKFLWALLCGNHAIGGSREVIQKSVGSLTSFVLRLFDHNQTSLLNIRFDLLLTLLSVDHATVNSLISLLCHAELWETRYTILDTLYLIITESTVTSNASAESLAQLFPVISHFFAFLSDSEDAVCTKASALVQSLRPPHFSAIAHVTQLRFDSGTVSDRTEVCRLVTSVALPQMLSWSSIIDAMFAQELDHYTSELIPMTDDEGRELWLHLVNTALRMLAEGIQVDRASTASKIKYHVYRALGFPDVSLRPSLSSGAVDVVVGTEPPRLGSTSHMALASLKRVLDCPKARKASDGKHLVGSDFVDVIPTLVLSTVELPSCSFLRQVLECLSISLYKHDLGPATTSFVDTVRSITDLLPIATISHDNRLLILNILFLFLDAHETASSSIVLHQILVVARVVASGQDHALTRDGIKFMRMAFVKFGLGGLFTPLFKSIAQSDDSEQIMSAIRIVMHDSDTPALIDGRDVVFSEAPLFDVFRSDFRDTISTNLVLVSLEQYSTMVNSSGWSLSLLQAFVEFLPQLLRYPLESDFDVPFDPNPMVSLAVSTLKYHPLHAHDLRQQINEILVAWLPSFAFKTSVLSSILTVSISRTNEESASRLSSVLSDGLSEGLRGRNGMSTSTMTALVEALLVDCGAPLVLDRTTILSRTKSSRWSRTFAQDPSRTCIDVLSYLYRFFEQPSLTFDRARFDDLRKVGDLLLRTIQLAPSSFRSIKGSSPAQDLRICNLVILSQLSNPIRLALLDHLYDIAVVTSLAVRSCVRGSLAEAGETIAQVYANVRLVVCLTSLATGEAKESMAAYWTTVWPSLEQLMAADASTPTTALAITSFVDLIRFLHRAGSSLALQHGAAWVKVLECSHGSPSALKPSKVYATLLDPPSVDSFDVLLEEVTKEVYIAFKLRMMR